jgi:hypothetical protein
VPLHFAKLPDQDQSLVLELPDPLRTDAEFIAQLAQRVVVAIPHPRPHPQDVGRTVLQVGQLALAEGVERYARQSEPGRSHASTREQTGVLQARPVVEDLAHVESVERVRVFLGQVSEQISRRKGPTFLLREQSEDAEANRVVQ